MRKYLVLTLLLLPVLSLNLTVQCDSNCFTLIPVNGHSILNYSVNGSKLNDVYRSVMLINASGSDISTLMVFNLTDYNCEGPGALFFDQDPISYASFENLLIANYSLTGTNTTFKLFCDGHNDLKTLPNWYDKITLNSPTSQANLTKDSLGKFILTGLTLNFSEGITSPLYEIELTNQNVTIADKETTNLNISSYNTTYSLQTYLTLPYSDYVYMDAGNLTDSNESFVVLSHGNVTWGNITVLDSGLSINVSMKFNDTKGVAILDYDSDAVDEIVACVNKTSTYQMTTFEFDGSWKNTSRGIDCKSFSSFDPVRYHGVNGSLVTFNSTSLVMVVFNQTISVYSESFSNIEDVASIDLDGDGYDEILVSTKNGDLKAYNITSLFSTSEIDYLGKLNARKVDAKRGILTYNNSLSLYSGNYLTNEASLKFIKSQVLAPVKITMGFTIGGSGNVTLNSSLYDVSGKPNWYFNKTYPAGSYLVELYPLTNGTLDVNFTFKGINSSYDPWMKLDKLVVHNVSLGMVNFSSYNKYTPSTFSINTTLKTDNFTIIGAKFLNSYNLSSILAFFKAGNHSLQFDSQNHPISLWKPSFSNTVSTVQINSTNPVQPSQSDSNFTAIAGFSTILHLVEENLNVSTYGSVIDYCSYNNYILYTYEKATLLKWTNSLSEIGNITGNFSQCWLSGDRIYLVNNTGGIEIYNYSLTKVDNFANSSFIVKDVVAINQVFAWNGTHLANVSANKFYNPQPWTTKIYGNSYEYQTSNASEITKRPSFDFLTDKLWDALENGLYSAVNGLAKIIGMQAEKITGFSNKVTAFFSNGTIYTNTLGVNTAQIGTYAFTTNVTYDVTENWISFDSTGKYRINISVTGFPHNSTDTLTNFSMTCSNSTYSKTMEFVKYSNNNFTLVNDSYSGKYSCKIIPVWETDLPKTFALRTFTMYSDSQTPTINNVTSIKYLSDTQAFNMTLNVTEDSEIKLVTIQPSAGSVTSATIKSVEIVGGFQIYNLSVIIDYPDQLLPGDLDFNVTVEDYTGKVSPKVLVENYTVYTSAAPQITIVDLAPGNNVQDFSSVPLNLSVQVASGDANLSYVNVTLWKLGALQNYSEATNINNQTKTVWLNKSLTSFLGDYIVTVKTEDITHNYNSRTFNITRYGKNTRTLDGIWWTTGVNKGIEYYWEKTLQSANLNDLDTGLSRNASTTFSNKFDAPDRAVDSWWTKFNVSTGNIKSVNLKYSDSVVSDVTLNLHGEYAENAVNTTDRPDTVLVESGVLSVGSAEKMCLYICDSYDVSQETCLSASGYVQKSCAAADDDQNTFAVGGTDSRLDQIIGNGVAFRISVVAITSPSTPTQTPTETPQTVTTTADKAVITITAPTSKTTDVGSCVDVEYSIKNTGSIAGSISGITVSGFSSSEMTYSMLSDINWPYLLGTTKTLKAILSFCPLKPKVFNPSVCAKVGSSNKCVSVKITGTGEEETPTGPLNMEVSVETFEKEYIVFVNSTTGPVENADVTIIYSDGTNETFTTNVFGKVNFEPKLKDFTVEVNYGDEKVTKEVQKIIEKTDGFTIWRILIDFLIVGTLIGFGVVLDEKMI